MQLFFAGTEQKMWRSLLASQDVEHVSLSYIGLRRRIKNPAAWSIAENFPEGQKVFLDSGAFTLNKPDSDIEYDEAVELAEQYASFVLANIDRIEFFSEFDANVLEGYVQDMRDNLWDTVPAEKFMPVWHGETGAAELERLAGLYALVGVLQGDSGNADISALLRRLSARTKLHGVAMTRMEAMSEIPWSSVGSTSWLSPTQYGDTFVWTGHEMKRYPKRYKEQGRKRHRTWLADQGFDTDLIEADDNAELLRLSIWSWQHFAASLKSNRAVTTDVLNPFGQNVEQAPDVVAALPPETGNAELVPSPARKMLPVLGITTRKGHGEDGEEIDVPHLTTPSTGLLRCDNCFMREKCPEMRPGSDCAFEIPMNVRTGSQLAALQDWLIETQAQRVAFMRLVEMAEGGYSDANLSIEIDRLNRLVKTKADAGKEGFSINIANVATPGGPGMISRIFGADVTSKMGELPAPVDAQAVIEAEIVPDDQ